jgi:hypothetical protein
MAASDIDLVHLMPVPVRLAKDYTMAVLVRDPGDGKRVFLGTATETECDRFTDRDP